MRDYSIIEVALEGTHHRYHGQPLYKNRFEKVLKFHAPGLAPAYQQGRWFHINEQGEPAYDKTFDRIFGFYHNKAAVELEKDSFHITPQGEAVYAARYAWCGNYQEELCAVQDYQGQYFHIDAYGKPAYPEKYTYAGDFKDHFAVVQQANGRSTHIDKAGNYVHNYWYDQLDLFHKGFARAKDAQGWFHITPSGNPVYPQRYRAIEPFYNGVAYVETGQGKRLLINEAGEPVKEIFQASRDLSGEVSGDMVGFWKTYTLYAAAKYQLFDHLPISIERPFNAIGLPQEKLSRLLKALWELGFVTRSQGMWHATDKGQLLVQTSFYLDAALMWTDVCRSWQEIDLLLKEETHAYRPSFKQEEKNPLKLAAYYRAIDGYAAKDLSAFANKLHFKGFQNILGIGRSALTMLKVLATKQPQHKYLFADHEHSIQRVIQPSSTYIKLVKYDTPKDRLPAFDICLLPRFLHYFPDADASIILSHIKNLMCTQGAIYVVEMILDENIPNGYLLDMNMMVETNGKERTLAAWKHLYQEVGLELREVATLSPIFSVMKLN